MKNDRVDKILKFIGAHEGLLKSREMSEEEYKKKFENFLENLFKKPLTNSASSAIIST